jgi:predicted acetyltransferase
MVDITELERVVDLGVDGGLDRATGFDQRRRSKGTRELGLEDVPIAVAPDQRDTRRQVGADVFVIVVAQAGGQGQALIDAIFILQHDADRAAVLGLVNRAIELVDGRRR